MHRDVLFAPALSSRCGSHAADPRACRATTYEARTAAAAGPKSCNRHDEAEQRHECDHNHTLLGDGAPHELTTAQLADEAHETPCRKETHGHANGGTPRPQPQQDAMGGGVRADPPSRTPPVARPLCCPGTLPDSS